MAYDLETAHNYERFISRTMDGIVNAVHALPPGKYVPHDEPTAPPLDKWDFAGACYKARGAWRTAQHQRHMAGFYGVGK